MNDNPTKRRPATPKRVEAAPTRRRIPVFAIAIAALVVVLLGAGIAVAVLGGGDGDSDTLSDTEWAFAFPNGEQAFSDVTATGTPLPEYDDEAGPDAEDPAVGEPAPTLEGQSAGGDPITIDPGDGPMVVVFLAHWCEHCQAEVPRIVELADGSDEIEGVPFVAVLTGSERGAPNFSPGTWLVREDWPAPNMVDSEPEEGGVPVAFDAYGVHGYPFLVAIDADGNVAARSAGELGDAGLRDFFAQVAADA